ncbi:unnamed protein product [Ixodes hexagonus]
MSMNDDVRKQFIVNTASTFFAVPTSSLESESGSVDTFLDDLSCHVLAARNSADGDRVSFSTKLAQDANGGHQRTLVFFKLQSVVITPENLFSHVFVSTLISSPLASLHCTLRVVFSPLLLSGGQWNTSPKFQTLLGQLQGSLSAMVRQQQGTGAEDSFPSATEGILSPSDEHEFWLGRAEAPDSSKAERKRSETFASLLAPLGQLFSGLGSVALADCTDVLESAFGLLEDLWKQERSSPPYPQPRMVGLLDSIGDSTLAHLQSLLSQVDLWSGRFSEVAEQLRVAVEVCLRWQDICQKLTSLFWPNFGPHPWKGPPFVPTYLLGFTDRLQQILSVRTVHQQLLKLLPPDVSMDAVFEPFSSLHCLQYNPYTEPLWKSALMQHEARLSVFEQRAAERLRQRLTAAQGTAVGVIADAHQSSVRNRNNVRSEFFVELKILLGKLSEYVEDIKQQSKHGTGPDVINVPEVVKNIIHLRHLQAKVWHLTHFTMESSPRLLLRHTSVCRERMDLLTFIIVESEPRDIHNHAAISFSHSPLKILLGARSIFTFSPGEKNVLFIAART